jgi:hypothetical protein
MFHLHVKLNEIALNHADIMNKIMLKKLNLRIFLFVDRDKDRLHRTT